MVIGPPNFRIRIGGFDGPPRVDVHLDIVVERFLPRLPVTPAPIEIGLRFVPYQIRCAQHVQLVLDVQNSAINDVVPFGVIGRRVVHVGISKIGTHGEGAGHTDYGEVQMTRAEEVAVITLHEAVEVGEVQIEFAFGVTSLVGLLYWLLYHKRRQNAAQRLARQPLQARRIRKRQNRRDLAREAVGCMRMFGGAPDARLLKMA